MPLAAWRENSSRHVASLRRIRLVFFIAPVSSTITGRDYPQWTDLRKYVAELPVTKNDRNDAEAIACAASQPRMPQVPIKSEEQQAVMALHRFRARRMKE